MYTKGELCSCGFPQSHPIPHEHDRTDRENQIIAHFENTQRDLYEACKGLLEWYEGKASYKRQATQCIQRIKVALAKAK